jgi:hypothetical protein
MPTVNDPFHPPPPTQPPPRRRRDLPTAPLAKMTREDFERAYLDYLNPDGQTYTNAHEDAFRDDRVIERTYAAAIKLNEYLKRNPRRALPSVAPAAMPVLRGRLAAELKGLGPLVEAARSRRRAEEAVNNAPSRARKLLAELMPELFAELRERLRAGESFDDLKAEMLSRREELPDPAHPRRRRPAHRHRHAS